MKKISAILICLLFVQYELHSQLSTRQKVEDFEFLSAVLEENYPFLEAYKRQKGIDWMSKKSGYLEIIQSTPNDSAFYKTLMDIINDLACPHLGLVPPDFQNYMLQVYRQGAKEKPKYEKWAEVLEKAQEKSEHWQTIWNSIIYTGSSNNVAQETQTANYSDSVIVDDKIAIMRIKSFLYDNVPDDSVQITSFLKKVQNYDYLVIDIQDNYGGSSNYWKKHIVGKITDMPVTFPRNQVAKNGSMNRTFHPDFFDGAHAVTKENVSFPNIPDEILDGSYYIKTYKDTIMPDNPIPFKGKIFLLVNNWVTSASDDFAYFCKASAWAVVAGIRTWGEGACAEPTLFMLPNSGIVLNHPSVAGLNQDGSFNFETRTVPDIEIQADNADERLKALIEYIRINSHSLKYD